MTAPLSAPPVQAMLPFTASDPAPPSTPPLMTILLTLKLLSRLTMPPFRLTLSNAPGTLAGDQLPGSDQLAELPPVQVKALPSVGLVTKTSTGAEAVVAPAASVATAVNV